MHRVVTLPDDQDDVEMLARGPRRAACGVDIIVELDVMVCGLRV